MQDIKFIDIFAGIGGFRSGLEAIGGFECIGHCEIDKYANQAYNAMYDTKGEVYYQDARKIIAEEVPNIDLICGGFPCQSFSIAGMRGGFADSRGTLFFEIARIAAVKKPSFLFLENVPGLLSHDKGGTFAVILNALDELGYDVVWQVCNSANFGVPQSRQRVFLVGYLRERCAGEVLSFTEANGKNLIQCIPGREGERVYSENGLSCTLTSGAGGFALNTGLYQIESANKTIDTELRLIDMNYPPTFTELARCVTARHDSGVSKHKGEHSGVFEEIFDEPCAVLTPDKENVRQHGRRIKGPNEPAFTVTVTDKHGILHRGRIRKLTPLETWRLQGFKDEQFYTARATGLSDSRLYKMAGNAVSVPVISAIGEFIKRQYYKGAVNG